MTKYQTRQRSSTSDFRVLGKVGSRGISFLDGKDDVMFQFVVGLVLCTSVNVVDGIGVGWFVDIIVLSNC